ncbi:MAG: histidine kinase [Candidatus Didemnitutus sp.]|nr:histidine kinase [Candidatus Didemnitutus sp.]
MLRWVAGLLGLAAALTAAEVRDPQLTGTPFLRVWAAEEYGGAPVNWQIVQHPASHFIYAANNFGVLEYDGAAWRLIETANEGRVRTVIVDTTGTVWAAGDDIARLEPDAHGMLRAHSQRERLPAAGRAVGSVAFAAATNDAVAFANARTLFVFPRDGAPFVLPINDATVTSLWTMDGSLHVALNNGSVHRIAGSELAPPEFPLAVPDPEVGANRIVYGHAALTPDELLLATNRGLLATKRGAAQATLTVPLPPEISNSQITAAAALANGGYACATVRDGLLVFDGAGRLVRRIDRRHGLPGNRIDWLTEDAEGGLWLASRTGLARVQLDSPFALHGAAQGLEGGPRSLLRHAGKLYVGHNEGLAVSTPEGTFREIPGMRLGTNRLIEARGRLLVTSGALREVLPDDSLRPLVRQALQPIITLRNDPALLVGGNTSGVWLDMWNGDSVRVIGRFADVPGPIVHLLETADGFVWAVNPSGAVWRIDFRRGARLDAPVRAYGETDGLRLTRRRDEPLLFTLGDSLIVSSAQGLLRYDSASDRFVPEDRVEGIDARVLGATEASHDAAGQLWLRLGPPARELVRLVPIAPDRWRAEVIPTAPLATLVSNGLYADSATHTLWLAGQGALVSVGLEWRPAREAPPLHVTIRGVHAPEGPALLDPASSGRATLPAEHSALHVRFAAPTYRPDYRGRTATLYRTRLDGLDQQWSDWSPATHRDFTNLPYRSFVFRVQARDLSGRLSEEAQLQFAISPPWWLSPLALAGYVALFALLVALYIRIRLRALRRRNEQLEAAVAARTQELHRQNQELARLHQLELDEKTSARLAEEKARLEVLRYQLNPHFLFNALNSVCAQIMREPSAAREMVVRLADFCRLTLHRPGHEETEMTVGQELKQLAAYLEIEQARLGELMSVEIVSDDTVRDVRIPPFLLLPLVENAVKYGTATSAERLGVRLTVRGGTDDTVEIEVANTGEWLEPGAHSAPSHGIGLENLRQRLGRYYPGKHEFRVTHDDGWVRIHLRIPQRLP